MADLRCIFAASVCLWADVHLSQDSDGCSNGGAASRLLHQLMDEILDCTTFKHPKLQELRKLWPIPS